MKSRTHQAFLASASVPAPALWFWTDKQDTHTSIEQSPRTYLARTLFFLTPPICLQPSQPANQPTTHDICASPYSYTLKYTLKIEVSTLSSAKKTNLCCMTLSQGSSVHCAGARFTLAGFRVIGIN
ncbi:hypothetical protein EYC84_010254 [Monilinia fructicola]|uniref:Uncharacterized protein n=1 Tax=Monilinia fructicola TaxID=38448 RepID=A0A5M9JHK8_MONFR|nr:hypothetical protein EYC84_010254 [Monilinia fructicola]